MKVKDLEENVVEQRKIDDQDLPNAIRKQIVKENEVLDQILEEYDHDYEGTDPVIDAARIYKKIQISHNIQI